MLPAGDLEIAAAGIIALIVVALASARQHHGVPKRQRGGQERRADVPRYQAASPPVERLALAFTADLARWQVLDRRVLGQGAAHGGPAAEPSDAPSEGRGPVGVIEEPTDRRPNLGRRASRRYPLPHARDVAAAAAAVNERPREADDVSSAVMPEAEYVTQALPVPPVPRGDIAVCSGVTGPRSRHFGVDQHADEVQLPPNAATGEPSSRPRSGGAHRASTESTTYDECESGQADTVQLVRQTTLDASSPAPVAATMNPGLGQIVEPAQSSDGVAIELSNRAAMLAAAMGLRSIIEWIESNGQLPNHDVEVRLRAQATAAAQEICVAKEPFEAPSTARTEVTVLVNGRAVARIVPLETPAWVAGERAGRIYGSVVDPVWEDELRVTRQDDAVGDPWG